MKRLNLWAVAASFAIEVVTAQTLPQAPEYRFEVAAIKPSDPKSSEVWLIPEAHGGFRGQNVTVWDLIKSAYYIRDQQLTGGPPWIKTDRYDIIAKPEEIDLETLGAAMSALRFTSYMARHRQRMQALLSDRFGLVLGTETKVMPFYSLRLAKTGNKMQAVDENSPSDPIARMRNGQLAMTTDMKGIVVHAH